MARTDVTLPRPTSLYSGALGEAWGLVRSGHLRRAASHLATEDPATVPDETWVPRTALLLTCRLGLGDIASAAMSGDDLATAIDGDELDAAIARLGLGELATALGDHQAALEHYLQAGLLPGSADPDLPAWRAGAVMALIRIGRRPEAVTLAHELLVAAEDTNDPHLLAVALRTLATADTHVDPIRTLTRARGLAVHSSDLRLVTQIDTDIAGLLLLMPPDEQTAEALTLLRTAEAYAASEGLWPLHARVSRLLDRAGERVRPVEGDALSLLTNAEQRVARLAAAGLTNRQIAEQLTVTVKGVEWHLSRVYRKLGIASRDGLRASLERIPKPRTESA